MTFDRLSPNFKTRHCICFNVYERHGKAVFKVISVPSTFIIDPGCIENLLTYEGINEAIQANQLISSKRKEYLVQQIRMSK